MENKEYYTLEELKDEFIPKGTKEREEYENDILEIKNEVLSKLIKSQPGLKGLEYDKKCYIVNREYSPSKFMSGNLIHIYDDEDYYIVYLSDSSQLDADFNVHWYKLYKLFIPKNTVIRYTNLSKDQFKNVVKIEMTTLIDRWIDKID